MKLLKYLVCSFFFLNFLIQLLIQFFLPIFTAVVTNESSDLAPSAQLDVQDTPINPEPPTSLPVTSDVQSLDFIPSEVAQPAPQLSVPTHQIPSSTSAQIFTCQQPCCQACQHVIHTSSQASSSSGSESDTQSESSDDQPIQPPPAMPVAPETTPSPSPTNVDASPPPQPEPISLDENSVAPQIL